MRETALFGNRSDIGCFTDDDHETAQPTSVTWVDASEFVIETTDGAGVRVEINPDGSIGQITQAGHNLQVPCPWT
jgi:hypothetical protein